MADTPEEETAEEGAIPVNGSAVTAAVVVWVTVVVAGMEVAISYSLY
jgi:hypothetical protein